MLGFKIRKTYIVQIININYYKSYKFKIQQYLFLCHVIK